MRMMREFLLAALLFPVVGMASNATNVRLQYQNLRNEYQSVRVTTNPAALVGVYGAVCVGSRGEYSPGILYFGNFQLKSGERKYFGHILDATFFVNHFLEQEQWDDIQNYILGRKFRRGDYMHDGLVSNAAATSGLDYVTTAEVKTDSGPAKTEAHFRITDAGHVVVRAVITRRKRTYELFCDTARYFACGNVPAAYRGSQCSEAR